MEILVKASQFVLSLSILIILHELGHFIPARLFKTRVDKFYLFFDPWFSLFKFKRGETEYGIGWLPLGGYVKIAGMIDESMDKEQMKLPPQEWEFRSKPAWQRLIIMLGGVTVNVILGVFIYTCILFAYGEEYLPTENATYGISVDALGKELGLQNGDKIISVNGKKIENFSKIVPEIVLHEAKYLEIERESIKQKIEIPSGFIKKVIEQEAPLISMRVPAQIESFPAKSQAKDAGMMEKDKITAVNDVPVFFNDEVKAELAKNKEKKVAIDVNRAGESKRVEVLVNKDGTIGFFPNTDFLVTKKKEYSFLEVIPAGFEKTYKTIGMYIDNLKLIFSPEVRGYEQIGGFIAMGKIFSPVWDWQHFWNLTALLSIVLAVMNILPIPALDGGHVMFLLYEVITRRKPNEKVMEYAQVVGMVILLSLFVFANGNDVIKLFK